MKSLLKKHWGLLALLMGFFVLEIALQCALYVGDHAELTEETDLGSALMGALTFYMCILLLYLLGLICAAAAFFLSSRKLKTETDRTTVILAVVSTVAVLFTIVQAIVTVWQNFSWIVQLPQLLG